MPIQALLYDTLARISITLDDSYAPEMQKSQACDRLLNLIYDETFTHASEDTQLARIEALARYHNVKRSMEQGWYPYAGASVRSEIRDYSLNNALVEFGEIPVGRSGRYHRAVMSVINEAPGHTDKSAAMQIWLNNTITAIKQDFDILEPPTVAENTVYRINQGPAIINTGNDIEVTDGDRLDMYTSGVNFGGVQWTHDGSDVAGAVEETLRLSPVTTGDEGDYICVLTNQTGSTPSSVFTVVIT